MAFKIELFLKVNFLLGTRQVGTRSDAPNENSFITFLLRTIISSINANWYLKKRKKFQKEKKIQKFIDNLNQLCRAVHIEKKNINDYNNNNKITKAKVYIVWTEQSIDPINNCEQIVMGLKLKPDTLHVEYWFEYLWPIGVYVLYKFFCFVCCLSLSLCLSLPFYLYLILFATCVSTWYYYAHNLWKFNNKFQWESMNWNKNCFYNSLFPFFFWLFARIHFVCMCVNGIRTYLLN